MSDKAEPTAADQLVEALRFMAEQPAPGGYEAPFDLGSFVTVVEAALPGVQAEARATADAELAECQDSFDIIEKAAYTSFDDAEKLTAALAAEKERVARLREAGKELLRVLEHNVTAPDWRPVNAAYDQMLVLLTADTAPAEPRWPSGPDAERELAAAILTLAHGKCCWEPEQDAKDVIAALQEKRDPGE